MKRVLFLAFALVASSAQVAPPGVKTVFVKNNEIFVTADGSQPRRVTHDGIPKFLPVWSKDGSKIAFNRRVDSKQALSELVVIDENGNRIADVMIRPAEKAPSGGMRFVENVEWISSDTVAVGGSINPGLTETLVLDLKTGEELNDIYDDDGGAIFSPDGAHVAYVDGMPHFSPQDTWQPELNIDYTPVLPKSGTREVFLTPARWSADSHGLAVVAQDYRTKKVSVFVWHPSEAASLVPLDLVPSGPVDLFWTGAKLYVRFMGHTWRVQDGDSVEVAAESAADPFELAKLEEKKLESIGRDADFWCQSCSLANLPRRQTVNK